VDDPLGTGTFALKEETMTTLVLLTGLLLCPPCTAATEPGSPQLPDRPGVFAVTERGTVELPVFGEQRKVEGAIETFAYAESDLERIPVVASISALYVNVMGWTPKDLYLIVGRQRLATPRDDYRRLNGRAYSKGPILFEVVTEKLEPEALEKEYRRLAKKKRSGEDVRAFVVLELISQAGLNRRSYPIQVDLPPGSAAK
jgi:hypothetical protein